MSQNKSLSYFHDTIRYDVWRCKHPLNRNQLCWKLDYSSLVETMVSLLLTRTVSFWQMKWDTFIQIGWELVSVLKIEWIISRSWWICFFRIRMNFTWVLKLITKQMLADIWSQMHFKVILCVCVRNSLRV